MVEPLRILILGGTGEARRLAGQLDGDPRFHVETSLAGATANPAKIAGDIRRGGFGGAVGLEAYLSAQGIDLVVDATHPFADTISRSAVTACENCATDRLVICRPTWEAQAGDRWISVANVDEAAARVSEYGTRVFLTIGRQEIDAFEECRDIWFLIRLIDLPPTSPLLNSFKLISDRGPFDLAADRRIFQKYKIDCIVSKNSGGTDTYPKIKVAREAGIPVIMIERPEAPKVPVVDTAKAALEWIEVKIR
jgi:precorrin-6A/cobalt-precorrin-6A reductase